MRILYYLKILHWYCLGAHMKKRIKLDNQTGPLDQTKSNRTTRSDRQIRPIQFGPPVQTTKKNTHNSWFQNNLMAHEYLFESLWSLLSNTTSFTSFWLPSKDLWSDHWRLLRMSRVCSRIYLAQLPVQNCTILKCFMVHATHAWKSYQV